MANAGFSWVGLNVDDGCFHEKWPWLVLGSVRLRV